jgi:hypothetical protein
MDNRGATWIAVSTSGCRYTKQNLIDKLRSKGILLEIRKVRYPWRWTIRYNVAKGKWVLKKRK